MKCDAIDTFMGFSFSILSFFLSRSHSLSQLLAATTETMEVQEAGTLCKKEENNASFSETKQSDEVGEEKRATLKIEWLSTKNETSL